MILVPVLHMMGQFYGTQTSKFLLRETAKPLRGSEAPHCDFTPHCECLGAAEAQFCSISGSSRSFYRNYSFYNSTVLLQRAYRIKFSFSCHHFSDSRTQLSMNRHNNQPQKMAQLLQLEMQTVLRGHSACVEGMHGALPSHSSAAVEISQC